MARLAAPSSLGRGAIRARRGSAMVWVLSGMGLAALIGGLAWTRAWTHRDRAAVQAARWQAQLLAESALACAEDSVWAMLNGGTAVARSTDTSAGTRLDSALAGAAPVSDSASSSCLPPPLVRGEFEYSIEDGTLLVPVHASGRVPFGSRTIDVSIRAMLAGALDRDLFDVAVSHFGPLKSGSFDVSGANIVGGVRVKVSGSPLSGTHPQPRGIELTSYVPTRSAKDTTILENVMREAFRSDDAFSGGAAYSSARSFPDRDRIIHTGGGEGREVSVEIEGPLGKPGWTAPAGRTLVVEGDVTVRGRATLEGWTILVRGKVVLEGDARLREGVLYAAKGVVLAGDASFQGQILSPTSLEIHERARLEGPTVALCWSADSGRVVLDGSAVSDAYLVSLGSTGRVEIGRDATFEGVVVSNGTLRVDGRVHGVAVASSFRCGRGEDDCTGQGVFDRTRLPSDFAVPVGLPGAKGLRVVSWESAE